MRAAFLIRCSTKKQDYERQVKDLTRLAKQFGYEYSESTIYGEHITGKDDASVRDRISIQHLKEGAENKMFDVVLVSEVSRMSRDPVSGRWYVRQLINMDTPVYFRDIDTWTIDPNTGKKVKNAEMTIGGAFDAAWKYLQSMKTQIASGRRDELDNNCMSIGQPFFGYTRYGGKDKTTKNRWVIDEDAKEVVIDTYNEYLKEGATLKSTALAITAKYGEKFGKKFSIGSINHILCFEPYATGIKVVSLKDPDNEDVVDTFNVEIPTIISRTLFEKVKAKRATNRVTTEPYPKQKVYTLSKLIKCPHCGHSLTPRKIGDNNYSKTKQFRMVNGKIAMSWICMSGINNSTDCSNRTSICNEKLEAIIWGLVSQELIYFSDLNTEDRLAKIEEIDTKIKNIDANIANFTSQIAQMDKRVEKAYNAYLDAPEAVAELAKERYHKTLIECQNEKADCESKIDGFNKDKERLGLYRRSLTQPTLPDDAISKAESDPVEKRRIVKELIDVIYPHKITTYVSPATHKIMKNGILLLEVYTIDGIYYILYDGNQRKNKIAYYINNRFAFFQNGKSKSEFYKPGEYFAIPNASMVMDTEELEEYATFNEMIEICKANNWEIDYTYK